MNHQETADEEDEVVQQQVQQPVYHCPQLTFDKEQTVNQIHKDTPYKSGLRNVKRATKS